jgi:NADPH:quinone reductase-like Zn-dependent oxidoreductase/acyl carrier protein
VTVRPGDSRKETLTGHLELFDETGQLAAELQELTFKRATRQALQGAIQKRFDDWLYEVAWRPKASNQTQAMPVDRWLIFADRTGVGEALASRLVEQGSLCDLVFPGETYAVLGTGRWQINPSGADDFERLMRESIFQESQLRRGVVYLWSAEADSPEETTLSILHLVQALSGDEGGLSRLWLVTRGAQPVTSRAAALALAQAPVWGLGKVIALEHPDLRCVCVDLDPAREVDEAEILMAELLAEESEPQVAWRNLTRYVARLAHSATKAKLVTQPFELNITARGVLDNIVLRPLTRRQPGAGEIEIEVRASGLNFRDVLNVLGMYPGDPGPPGTECAGTVAAVGEGVTQLKVGDSVMGIAARAFNSYAISRADCVAPKPEHLSFAEAATIPIAFLTALYGLHHLAGMKPGARVLIHAAAGGVGLAAVQLAKQAGAEIFGTAGSPEKRAFLKSLGVQHVLNSRTLDFADEVMAITKGQGVDIVLNSLADEFIPKSLSVLAPEGCFLEIGKRGIWSAEQVKQLKPGATYFAYDLSDVLQTNGPLWRSMFQSLIADFERGALKPLPLQPFSTHEIVDAFRYMAQAKHTGKVVIVHTPVGDLFRADSSYLITGGLGGLGLKVAQWMVTQGVRHLALLGRSSASQTAREALREMEQAGVQVRVLQADVSQTAQVANRLAEIAQTMPPLRGIVHAAGILADSVLRQQDRERFIKVMGPKVAGSWTLHELTRGLPLDFFVLFSSASSLLGSAGQGNYAAANTFMDALAHDRQAQGLPALSINWGAWAEVGMAAGLGDRDQRRWSQQGMGLIQPEQGVQAFGQLLRLDVAQIGLLPIHWPMLKKQLGADVPPFWSEVVREAAPASANTPAAEAKQDLLNQLASTAPEARYALLLKHVQEQVARVFGLDPAQPLDLQQNLTEMGMDSLMAVELKNRIELNLGLALPMVKILEGPSVAELARQVLDQLHTAPANEAVPEAKPSRDDEQKEAERLLAQLDQLSEAEVDTLLTDLLAQEAHLS